MRRLPREKGFSLLMIVLIFVVVAAAGVGAAFFAAKIKTIAAERQTIHNMQAVREAMKKYYRGHQDLPDPVGPGGVPDPNGTEVPTNALNLKPSFGKDAWGQPLYYYRLLDSVLTARTDIRGVQVEGGPLVAGVIISRGLDQKSDFTRALPTPPAIPYTRFTTTANDVALPVDVQAEAIEIAVAELVNLSQKSCACIKAGCSTVGDYLTLLINTYLLNESYRKDPWLHDYQLAAGSNFYSYGPDPATPSGDADDIYGPPVGIECLPSNPISGFDFDPADIIANVVVLSSVPGAPAAFGLIFPALGMTPHAVGGADGGGYISFAPVFLNTGLTVVQDLRPDPSAYPKLTVSVWIRTNLSVGTRAVFSTDVPPNGSLIERLFGVAGGFGAVSNGTNALSVSGASGAVSTAVWHHLAAVYDQTVPNVTLYLDNVAVIGPSPANMPNDQVTILGAYAYYIGVRGLFLPRWIFSGDIDEFRIYPDALSAAQVGVLYHEFHP